MIKELDVYIWNRKVGTLTTYAEKYTEKVCFYFNSTFLKQNWDLFPLQAPINSIQAQRNLPFYADADKIFGNLPSFIADSLPDDWGNRVFAQWTKKHGIRMKDISPLDRLAYMGSRAMGALEFRPAAATDLEQSFEVAINDLYASANNALSAAKNFGASLEPDILTESLFKVGTSAGGRRPKAIIHVNHDTNQCYSGQVPPPDGTFTPCIVKFDEHNGVPSAQIEYSFYLMAKEAGLSMMPSHLIKGDSAIHFLTERFDRKNGEKIHTQTLAATNPLASSYEDLFDTACRLGIAGDEMEQMFTAMAMNIFSGNTDDHSKNFSFMLPQNGNWHISPTYDYTFTVDPSAPGYLNHHSLSVCGKTQDITSEDLLAIGDQFNIKKTKCIVERCRNVCANYVHFAKQADVPDNWTDLIVEEIKNRID